jgi:chemotaxis protein methyltransferase CheR
MHAEGLETLSQLQDRLLHDPPSMERLLVDLSINVTSMFRDPSFYVAFREHVVPVLHTYPFTRIWCAGCSTGEEVFSLAILLHEEGLYQHTRIYATDINERVLQTARDGVFPLERMKQYTQNYIKAGGNGDFSQYYTAAYDSVVFSRSLTENVVFAQHNLAMDRSFNEFNVILCRNVMIYFDRALQDHVHTLFYESLDTFGILALGHKESINFTRYADRYESIDLDERIYRKVA